ncbi:hypothetical protein B9Z19DRAFT_694875 [Tuber borchii]|uniref:Uncharacterized protein n=1 Tax=Tuber borchii TaxID=42251 RepID=A0A2T6ZA70_TUBBO|nr:hypothetical protein B9Z19DRAFT_694875 [Tuber borchii]
MTSGHRRTYIRIAHFPKSGSPYPLSGEVITLDSIRCGRIGKSSDSKRAHISSKASLTAPLISHESSRYLVIPISELDPYPGVPLATFPSSRLIYHSSFSSIYNFSFLFSCSFLPIWILREGVGFSFCRSYCSKQQHYRSAPNSIVPLSLLVR